MFLLVRSPGHVNYCCDTKPTSGANVLFASFHLNPTDGNEIDVFYQAQRCVLMCGRIMANPSICFSAQEQCTSHVQTRSEH